MGSYPPPFSPPAPRKDNTLKIVLIILGVAAFMCVLLLGAAGVFGMKFFNQSIKPLAGCAIGFNDVREAMREYAKEHNDTLPAADKWQDEIRPYLVKVLAKNREDKGGIFPELDPNGNWGCDDGKGGKTGMAYNTEIAGKKIAEVKDHSGTILIFEVPDSGTNLAKAYSLQDRSKAPMIMSEHRQWLKLPLEGGDEFNFEVKNGKLEKTPK
ncbi:MAG: hypothetical protein U0S12_01130 [Fimbriimonadales bacterium]